MTRVVYLDTNVYSALCDRLPPEALRRAATRLTAADVRILLSPTNILEILLVPNDLRRERLIFVLQTLCDPLLLAEVESLIVGYVVKEAGLPYRHLELHDHFGRSSLRETWDDVHRNTERTFVVPDALSQQLRMFKLVESLYHAQFSRGAGLATESEWPDVTKLEAVDGLARLRSRIRTLHNKPPEAVRQARVGESIWILVAMILCVGLTPYPDPIDEFWTAAGITDLEARLEFAQTKLSFLSSHGYFVGMGVLMAWQATKRHSRGNFFDCYHLAYVPHVDEFLTFDRLLLEFARTNPESTNCQKVSLAENFVELLSSKS